MLGVTDSVHVQANTLFSVTFNEAKANYGMADLFILLILALKVRLVDSTVSRPPDPLPSPPVC